MFQAIFNMTDFVGVVLAVIFFSDWIDNTWHLDGWGARVRTWLIGIILALFCMQQQIGIFANPAFNITWMPLWFVDALLGYLAALVANFGFQYLEAVKLILMAIGIRVPIGTAPQAPAATTKV